MADKLQREPTLVICKNLTVTEEATQHTNAWQDTCTDYLYIAPQEKMLNIPIHLDIYYGMLSDGSGNQGNPPPFQMCTWMPAQLSSALLIWP